MVEQIRVKLVGIAPLIMHNGALVDPQYHYAKAIAELARKRKKTETDLLRISENEFYGSLWTDENGQIIVPSEALEACLIDGAKKIKVGPQARSGVFVTKAPLLEYGEKKKLTPQQLWGKKGFILRTRVRINRNAVIRTRPKFDSWSLEFQIDYMPDIISRETLNEILQHAGDQCGLGDWRPRYGRFKYEIVKG